MPAPGNEPDLTEFEEFDDVDELRKQLSAARTKIRRLRKEDEHYVEAIIEGVREAVVSLGKLPPVPAPKVSTGNGKPEVALWHLTDWQGSKVTTSYNTEVMRKRIRLFCDKADRLTAIQRADHPVKECVILFGGDLMEGLFNFPQQVFEVDATLFEQLCIASQLVGEVVRRAQGIYEKVDVIFEWGNHGRIGDKRAAVPRADNMDRIIAELAKAWLSGPDFKLPGRLTWRADEEDMHHFAIGNYEALLIHGDEIGRNGTTSITTIIKHVTGWKAGAYDKPFQDVYSGHLHSSKDIELPDGGMFYQSGSPETDNRYAGVSMAAASLPTQRLHFIDPRKGRVTAQYRVSLD